MTATDFGHPEGRRYTVAAPEILELPDMALESKKKMMRDNALTYTTAAYSRAALKLYRNATSACGMVLVAQAVRSEEEVQATLAQS